MWDSARPLSMELAQKAQLEAWVRAPTTPQKIVLRSRICLLAHSGLGNRQIARELNTSRPTVLMWRERFAHAQPELFTRPVDAGFGRTDSQTWSR